VLFATIIYGLFKAIELITAPVAVLTYFIYPLLTGIAAAMIRRRAARMAGRTCGNRRVFGLMLTIGANPRFVDRQR
jgi:hypothetical protein